MKRYLLIIAVLVGLICALAPWIIKINNSYWPLMKFIVFVVTAIYFAMWIMGGFLSDYLGDIFGIKEVVQEFRKAFLELLRAIYVSVGIKIKDYNLERKPSFISKLVQDLPLIVYCWCGTLLFFLGCVVSYSFA